MGKIRNENPDTLYFLDEQESSRFTTQFSVNYKLSKTKIEKNLADFKKKMLDEWESLPEIFVTSSNKKQGLQEILKYISKLNLEYKPNLES